MNYTIFIPSYKRASNNKTLKYFLRIGADASKLVTVIDDKGGTDDIVEYERVAAETGSGLLVVDFEKCAKRFDNVTQPLTSRRAAGQFRNEITRWCAEQKVGKFIIIDDDTNCYTVKLQGVKERKVGSGVLAYFGAVFDFMERHDIGVFGLPQSGDYIGGRLRLFMRKVMNTTFYYNNYIQGGERACMDDDTSMFASIGNVGLLCGSLGMGVTLHQVVSGKSAGGLTEVNYRVGKLLLKSLMCAIQFPSACRGEYQAKNGGRYHHKIAYRYLVPCLVKGDGANMIDNTRWSTYAEDVPFRNDRI